MGIINLRLASLDITNMYTNIPTGTVLSTIKEICQNNYVMKEIEADIIRLSEAVIKQNYFRFMGKTFAQNDGLAMGAPTSSIFSEIYLQSLENQEIHQLLKKHNIKGYFRYVDDILIIYDKNTSNIHDITEDFNNITPELKFTLEKETNHQINYLDITIQRTQSGFYRHLQENYNHRLHYTKRLLPPHKPQNGSDSLPIQQDEHIPAVTVQWRTRGEHHNANPV